MAKRVLLLQTCDGRVYKDLCDLSEPANRRYADRHGYGYTRYDGIKHGAQPWHASFNRIYLLQETLEIRQDVDWVLYLDADAVVVDHTKPVDEFLLDSYAVVACRGASDSEDNYWEVNDGVAFFNLRHPEIPHIIRMWRTIYENAPFISRTWRLRYERTSFMTHLFGRFRPHDSICDQAILQQILKSYQPPVSFAFKGTQRKAFNYDGPFIQQLLRGGVPLAKRVARMKAIVSTIHTEND